MNNGLIVEQRNGHMFELRSGPTYTDAVQRHKEQLEEWRPAIERVADLLLRTDTNHLPVLATAHFAANSLESKPESPLDERAVVEEVRRWKPALAERDIAEALRTLNVLGWISVAPSSDLIREPDFAELVG